MANMELFKNFATMISLLISINTKAFIHNNSDEIVIRQILANFHRKQPPWSSL